MIERIIIFTILLYPLFSFSDVDSSYGRINALSSQTGSEYVPGEVLVKYKSDAGTTTIQVLNRRLGIKRIKRFKCIDVHHIKLPPGLTVEEAIELYADDPNVEYAEPNYIRHTMSKIPNDAHFEKLWGLRNIGQYVNERPGEKDADIDAPESWEFTTGDHSTLIAVIDTGVDYTHPDLKNNIWSNPGEIPGDNEDNDGNGYIDDVRGWDFVDDGDNDPMDLNGHGTHLAGIIAAEGNNNIGVTGVCWNLGIIPLKAGNPAGELTIEGIVLAIDYAIDKGARVINASFAGEEYSKPERAAISKAREAGLILVAAAGNDGEDNDDLPQYPANYDLDNIITVAATNQNDDLAEYSNFGFTSVDVGAPGENIFSTWPDAEYRFLHGTSVAAPYVVGMAGLIWSLYPDLTSKQLKNIILDSGDKNDSLGDVTVTGRRINTLNGLNEAASITPNSGSSGGGDSCFIAAAAFGSSHETLEPLVRRGVMPLVWTADFLVCTSSTYKRVLLTNILFFTLGMIILKRLRAETAKGIGWRSEETRL